MKKFFLMMTAALALSLVSCNGNKDYKTRGEELSKQLDEQVEKKDTTGVLSSDEMIRKLEAEIEATGDSASLAAFRESMKDSRIRNATFVTISKMHNGMPKEQAFEELAKDALKKDVDLNTLTTVINAVLKAEGQEVKE